MSTPSDKAGMTARINENPSAFPLAVHPDGSCVQPEYGMTLRDYFAGQALAGDMAAQNETCGEWTTGASDANMRERAAFFYRFADAMLLARQEQSS